MTRVNDYLWQLPHTPAADDPEDVVTLLQTFNLPLAQALEGPLTALGYPLRSSDIHIPPDKVVLMEDMGAYSNTYRANLRFIRYLLPDVITRIHFEHTEWSSTIGGSQEHRYVINLDRFKVSDTHTMMAVPAWEGRLHMRMSGDPARGLEHDGPDQVWSFSSAAELEAQITLFLRKFTQLGQAWLEDPATLR